jgi:hypothetical protein
MKIYKDKRSAIYIEEILKIINKTLKRQLREYVFESRHVFSGEWG